MNQGGKKMVENSIFLERTSQILMVLTQIREQLSELNEVLTEEVKDESGQEEGKRGSVEETQRA